MKRLVILSALLAGVWVVESTCQAQVWEDWAQIYPNSGQDNAKAIAVDQNHNVYVTGWVQSGSQHDYITIKYNSAGVQQWAVQLNNGGSQEASDIVVDQAGNSYVTGCDDGDWATVKYDSSGIEQWQVLHNGLMDDYDAASRLFLGEDSSLYVIGVVTVTPSALSLAVIKYNLAGVEQWAVSWSDTIDVSAKLPQGELDNDGNLLIGATRNSGGNLNYLAMKLNPQGQVLWAAIYDDSLHLGDALVDVGVDAANNCYVTGNGNVAGSASDITTVKYNPNGIEQWHRNWNDPSNGADHAGALCTNPAGEIFITGRYQPNLSQGDNCITLKYSSLGVLQWAGTYIGTNAAGNDQGSDIAADVDNNVYVTGETANQYPQANEQNFTILKYNSAGLLQWVQLYRGTGHDWGIGNAITLDATRNVYACGHCDRSETIWDCVTIKYIQSPHIILTLTPLAPPIVIPATGGSFQFYANVESTGPVQYPFWVWSRDRYPNGSYSPNLLGPVLINPPLGQLITRLRTQNVPGTWPEGEHWYIAYADPSTNYPAAYADSFSWAKLSAGANSPWISDAICSGEPFPGEPSQTAFIPSDLDLGIWPNPFNPTTAISYQLQAASRVSLKIYDTAGRLVSTLVEGMQEAGQHSVTFDGSKLASGIYLVKLSTGERTEVQKVVLMK